MKKTIYKVIVTNESDGSYGWVIIAAQTLDEIAERGIHVYGSSLHNGLKGALMYNGTFTNAIDATKAAQEVITHWNKLVGRYN